ncbi:MAG: hypothetical protein H7A25_02610 [Leptospiraceae bacterium]|nr:hypothetical protein [Leptospiraceae bacterium]
MKYFIFFLFTTLLYSCKAKANHILPGNVPVGAKYDRRINLFTKIENGKLSQWTKEGLLYMDCEVNQNGVLHGYCKTYQKENRLSSEGRMVNGNKDGLWKWYFPDGELYIQQEHNHARKRIYWGDYDKIGNEHGKFEQYYLDGKLEIRGYYDAGYKTGSWEKYYRNGQLEYRGKFNKDLRTGEWLHYYNTGTLEVKESFDEAGKVIYRTTYDPEGHEICSVTREKTICR